ncbi:MAG: translation elongation factor Ts [Acidobacteria bacterium]|nr:translation elongation factor Ts [Acidobacteriota bacterium]
MAISAQDVKKLRDMTGAGMMDCKEALSETAGDFEQAVTFLRKKGLAKAAKKAGRETREGLVSSYIHPGDKIGVLIEVNSETDFVARTDEFKELVRNLAMQVAAASPVAPRWVRREDVDAAVLDKEREIARDQAVASGKPPAAVEKIVEGKLGKFYEENCLLEQPYIRDPEMKVQDVVNAVIAKLGENIQVARFVRFQLGEGQ